MNKEKRRVPKLRFPGFTEDWEQRKLDSIGSTYTGLSGKTKEDFGHGEAQYITYLNVFQNTVSDITMTDKVEIDTTQNEVKYGDVLFTTSSETPEEVGMSSVWLGHMPNIYLNSFCFGFRPNQKIDPYFLGYSLRAPYMRDKIKILAQGISRYNISKNKVMELEISLPNNEEQRLLGNFLRNIDLSITLHQRKLEHLNLKKKALLQKLFPKNGERYPELRFPGFTDAWEQRKLGDLMEVTSVKRIHQADWTDSGVRFFRARDIVSSMNNEEVDNPVFISEDKYEEYSRISGKVIEGDLLVTGVGTIGVPYLIKDSTPLYFKDGNIIWFKNNNILNGEYFYYCFQNNSIQSQIYSASGKGTVGTYTIENGKKTSISYPSLKEQVKIGKLLDTMTIMITLHQRKLEHLQLQKKSLLQQMFV